MADFFVYDDPMWHGYVRECMRNEGAGGRARERVQTRGIQLRGETALSTWDAAECPSQVQLAYECNQAVNRINAS